MLHDVVIVFGWVKELLRITACWRRNPRCSSCSWWVLLHGKQIVCLSRRCCVVGWFYDPVGKGQGFELRAGEARLVGRVQKLLTLRSEPDCNLIWRNKAGRMGAVAAKCVRDCLLQLLLSREGLEERTWCRLVFLKRRVGAFLRLETLCPKLRSWNLVSWRDFLGLVARGLKSNSEPFFQRFFGYHL